jgi:hypothetical protein
MALKPGVCAVERQLANMIDQAYQNTETTETADATASLTQIVEQGVLAIDSLDPPTLVSNITSVFGDLPTVAPDGFTQEMGPSLSPLASDSIDPNAIKGPVAYYLPLSGIKRRLAGGLVPRLPGIHAAEDQIGWISGLQPMTFTVFIENLPQASSPYHIDCQVPLDSRVFDLTTLIMGHMTLRHYDDKPGIVFPSPDVTPLAGDTNYTPATPLLLPGIDLPQPLEVKVSTSIDLGHAPPGLKNIQPITDNPGPLTWNFDSDKQRTLGNPDDGPLPGGQGGSLVFSISPKKELASGTVVQILAANRFDGHDYMQAPEDKPLTYQLDNDLPTSKVVQLPRCPTSLPFPVQWGGNDVSTGVKDYTIYVSDNGGPFVPWLIDTVQTQAAFPGQNGHIYTFFSQARDNVLNIEPPHAHWDAYMAVGLVPADISAQVSVTRGGFRYDHKTGHFVQQVTVKNTGSSALVDPISLVLSNLSSNAVLFNQSGVTEHYAPLGSPFVDTSVGFGSYFNPGDSLNLVLEFTNPSMKGITYTPRIVSGPGCP